MEQRVGIARAPALDPKMLLMDGSFGALDALTRGAGGRGGAAVAEADQTAFMTAHDVDEAILIAGRTLLMTDKPDARVAEAAVNTLHKPPGHGPRAAGRAAAGLLTNP